jgi:hypothetical protein
MPSVALAIFIGVADHFEGRDQRLECIYGADYKPSVVNA